MHQAGSSASRPLALPPHARLAGCQLVGWAPGPSSSPRYRVHMDADVAIPLPDGTTLRGDLYRPAAPGRYPVLVAWSSYTKELQNTGIPLPVNEVGAVRYIVACGYAQLTVNARGTGRSGGTRSFQFDPQEQKDVAATIEWAATQPWCDGKAGMAGMSYFAVIQYLAAAARPAHLTAIFPYLGWTDFYRHAVYHGGPPSRSSSPPTTRWWERRRACACRRPSGTRWATCLTTRGSSGSGCGHSSRCAPACRRGCGRRSRGPGTSCR